MQLLKIKLAGFKSFVDPTTIDTPSQLVAIVGPNGCGKSNIIDAITWVMGESSPKYLRGEALTDVIFNGSNARKPVGQASVELIFDNGDGTIGGEYAKFAEISIKRVINRESDASYYLNGVRCRKRDVVDIFLHTGLGARSYTIIGQNMIGEMAQAKPDELRAHLERAAGISKYKERRHETELRMQRTLENLARVNDLRTELEKQLSHLKHQANVAEKFKTLKEQERRLRAELYGIQWQTLDKTMAEQSLAIAREETALEARHSELSRIDHELETTRQSQRMANDVYQTVQHRYYTVGNEMTRLEQDILHHQSRQQQLERDMLQADQEWQRLNTDIVQTEATLAQHEKAIAELIPALATADEETAFIKDQLEEAEEATHTWQNRWDTFNQQSAKTNQIAQVEKNRIDYLEQKISGLQKRLIQLDEEATRFNFDELQRELEHLTVVGEDIAEQVLAEQQRLDDLRHLLASLQEEQHEATKQLDHVRSDLQRLRGQQASLEALQQTALGQRDHQVSSWIKQYQLSSNARLAQHLEVETGWELAVEKVLGFCLQAICVDELSQLARHLEDLKTGNLCLFTHDSSNVVLSSQSNHSSPLLLHKVKSDLSLSSLFAGIYVAETLEEALTLSALLNANESVITRDGVWLNRSWLKVWRAHDPAAGVFAREQELKQIAIQISELEEQQNALEELIQQRREKIEATQQERDELQKQYSQLQARSGQVNAQRKLKEERLHEFKKQSERVLNEQQECREQYEQAAMDMTKSREVWEEALTQLEQLSYQHDELVEERDQARQQLQVVKEHFRKKTENSHTMAMRLQMNKAQQSAEEQQYLRLKQQLIGVQERKNGLSNELSAMPLTDALQKSLTETLDQHTQIETEVASARAALEQLEQTFRQLESSRQSIEKEVNKNRNLLESLRVDWQGQKVKADTLLAQINETDYPLETILDSLPSNITIDEWQAKLDQTTQRITRLGPINLMAIDEYASCLERKTYLDNQLEDLQSGLKLLDEAIAKIDKETRARFKETFDKVNARFQELFPTIFGGGKAYLELTSDNLLDAGVTMMACPPGKRNSSVYLLSGGEKSLTAIALIFSIFHLNPAPFCLLDEVDAALDDANVLRFTRIVKAMSEKTQFLFISHNKITIEMGHHLLGVTMNEPGVSRLVSVDIEKAMNLVGEEA